MQDLQSFFRFSAHKHNEACDQSIMTHRIKRSTQVYAEMSLMSVTN